jgi:hypothetical protein
MKTLPTLALATLALGFAAAGQAADAPRKARVATGAQVLLVPSGQAPAVWAAQRPKVRDLRPKARGTFD